MYKYHRLIGEIPAANPSGENGKAGLRQSAGEDGVVGLPNGNPYSPNNLEARLDGGKNEADEFEVGGSDPGVDTLAKGDGVLDELLTSTGDKGVCGNDKR